MQAQSAQLQPYGLLQLLSGVRPSGAMEADEAGAAFGEALETQLRGALVELGVDLDALDAELRAAQSPEAALAALMTLLQQLPNQPPAAFPLAASSASASTGAAEAEAALLRDGEALLAALRRQLDAGVATTSGEARPADAGVLVERLRALLHGETPSVVLDAAAHATLVALLGGAGDDVADSEIDALAPPLRALLAPVVGAHAVAEEETLPAALRALLAPVVGGGAAPALGDAGEGGGGALPAALRMLLSPEARVEGDEATLVLPTTSRAGLSPADGTRELSREALLDLIRHWGQQSPVEGERDAVQGAVTPPAVSVQGAAVTELSRPLVLDLQQLLRPGGEQPLVERMQWLARAGDGVAEIKLHPPSLGALDVRVVMEGDKANVQFFAANPVAREVIEAALPRLREAFGQDGVGLGDVVVADRPPQHQGGDAQAGSGSGYEGRGAGDDDSAEPAGNGTLGHSTLGALSQRLDLFV
ncbi:flagellar hook-length control protein FliK [Marichromatium bheemlicum]|uniref:Flagellar hook-length control protein FliK n=1 Tax=Marichromatium bheemlicum TaxID=365339 RepID=A0ABX1I852_9GAMM|nr:flagellar hook-length control protein FliK [Marichromatium bheemlicum]NKN33209.1 flagellar hook-length control protein FliK [Marichromatium bheemlicum]